jgi:hypothetical protein
VPEPVGPKIKLKLPEAPAPKITLKFGNKAAATDSPVPASEPSPQPQTNGTNGKPTPASIAPLAPATNGNTRQNPFRGSQSSGTPVPSLDQLERARSVSGSAPSPTPSHSAPVKSEEVARNSPLIPAGYNGTRGPSQNASAPAPPPGMPPPSTPSVSNPYSQGGYAQSFNHQAQYQNPNPNPSFDSKWRQPGKSTSCQLCCV